MCIEKLLLARSSIPAACGFNLAHNAKTWDYLSYCDIFYQQTYWCIDCDCPCSCRTRVRHFAVSDRLAAAQYLLHKETDRARHFNYNVRFGTGSTGSTSYAVAWTYLRIGSSTSCAQILLLGGSSIMITLTSTAFDRRSGRRKRLRERKRPALHHTESASNVTSR